MEVLNRFTNDVKTFLKDQTGEGKTVSEIIKNEKKLIASVVVLTALGNIAPGTAKENNTQSLTPITTAEEVYEANRWTQRVIADYFDVLHPQDKDKYLYLGLPSVILHPLQGDASLKENNDRADFYKVLWVPTWVINGVSKEQKSDNWSDTIGLKVIPEGIKTAKQYAQFEIIQEKDNFYTLKAAGINEELNKRKNLNVNLIVFKQEVNCQNNKDTHRTTILKRVAYKYPLGALGKKVKLENGKTALQNFSLNIPKTEQNQCQMAAFIQDMKTKEILAAGYTEMVDGETALFNWDNLPECTVDLKDIEKYTHIGDIERGMLNFPQYRDKTGLKEKVFSVQKAKDLKYLSLQLDYTDTEAQIYQVLAANLNPELKDKAIFKYNPKNNQVDITFAQPINGDKELFSFFIKINKPTIDGFKEEHGYIHKDVHFKMREFSARDSQNNLIKYQLREQKNYFPVRMCTIENPFDLKKNANIGKEDLDLLLTVFGSQEGDKDWKAEYDVYKEGVSSGRIDIADVTAIIKEIHEQDKLREAIKAANPQAQLPELEIQIEKIMPPFQLTKNEAINEQTISLWLEKRQAYQETIQKIKEMRRVGEMKAV